MRTKLRDYIKLVIDEVCEGVIEAQKLGYAAEMPEVVGFEVPLRVGYYSDPRNEFGKPQAEIEVLESYEQAENTPRLTFFVPLEAKP